MQLSTNCICMLSRLEASVHGRLLWARVIAVTAPFLPKLLKLLSRYGSPPSVTQIYLYIVHVILWLQLKDMLWLCAQFALTDQVIFDTECWSIDLHKTLMSLAITWISFYCLLSNFSWKIWLERPHCTHCSDANLAWKFAACYITVFYNLHTYAVRNYQNLTAWAWTRQKLVKNNDLWRYIPSTTVYNPSYSCACACVTQQCATSEPEIW